MEVKTSLGALSKNVVGIELDWRVTLGTAKLGTVTLVRVKSGRVTAISIDDPLHEIDEIAYEYDRKQFHRLLYVAL